MITKQHSAGLEHGSGRQPRRGGAGPGPGTQGGVLLVMLLTGAVIGVALTSYLWMVSTQNQATIRAQAWNSAIPLAEAGVEEALTQLQYADLDHLTLNNWADLGNGWYSKKHSLDTRNFYEVLIKRTDPPIIVSTGYVPAPLVPSSTLGTLLGQAVASSPTNVYVKRRIQVNTLKNGLFRGAVAAKGQIQLTGNNVTVDSFDSGDPAYSTLGKYDSTKATADGDVATNASDTGSGKTLAVAIDVGDADIKGHVSTGAGGTVSVTSNGSVGDLNWVNGGHQGIEDGWQWHDSRLDFSDVSAPFTSGYSTPVGGSFGGTNYTCVLNANNNATYKVSSFGGQVVVVGNVTLWATDSVNFGSGDSIYITPGSSLKLYVSAPSAVIGGSGVVNADGSALAFQYYGMPQNTSIKFSANTANTGSIYAPSADFTLGGGGNNDFDFAGACVVNSFKMNGHYHLHFDKALRSQIWKGYVAKAWNELDANAPLN